MNQNETQWDKLLKIRTTGRDDSHADQHRYPYEPTPYCVLERLANSGMIGKQNTVLDYFSGAMENREMAVSGARTCFVKADAGEYSVPKEVDRCYFFNPFSIEILQKVLARIYESFYEHPREIQLLFYYPADAYVSYLMTEEQLMFSDEIDCMDLFEGENPREKILVFEIV